MHLSARLIVLCAFMLSPVAAQADPTPPHSADVSLPAVAPPTDGLWDWINRMDGELPTEDAVQAIAEHGQLELSEAAIGDRLATIDIPTDVYLDPVKVISKHPLFLDQIDPSEFNFPVIINPSVEKWVRFFTGPGKKHFRRWLERSSKYQPLMLAELKKVGLPSDLVYLSMIESGYNAHAYSHASAAGLWQFMPTTGRFYDLRVDWWVDDRRDPLKSTQAAARYLVDLKRMFKGDLYLAAAAYNGGPGRVRKAIRKSGSSDFWVIQASPYLHSETDNYVPKIIAASIIAKHPDRYGFKNIKPQSEFTFETVKVAGSYEITALAKIANVSEKTFRHYNPGLRRWATPPEGYEVRLPVGQSKRFKAKLGALPKSDGVQFIRHDVKKGDTIGTIAKKYSVTVSDIQKANNLANINRIYVGMKLVVPLPAGKRPPVVSKTVTPKPIKKTSYTVKKGDTLGQIAARFGVSTDKLRAWNNIKGSTIYVGQVIKLRGDIQKAPNTYIIKRGDTLGAVASRYRVKTSDLQRWNNIKNPSSVKVGQVIKLGPTARSSWNSHHVKKGESLGKIATKYGCSVADLKRWNSLKNDVIQPGQTLKIHRK